MTTTSRVGRAPWSTTRPSPPSSRSSTEDRNGGRESGGRPRRDPDVASAVLGRSLKTTNGLESINALIEERCAKVDHWQNSSQRQRWLATALLDIEPRLRKVMGYRHLPRLRDALKRELKIDTTAIQEPRRVSTRNGLDSMPMRSEGMAREV